MLLFQIIIISVFIILAGCQSNSVSVDEAKNITAKFSHTGFVAPPRSIEDITDVLLEPEISALKTLAPHCNGQEKDGRWVETFKDYLTRYKPNQRIRTEVDPVGGWKFKHGWELYRGISISEFNRGNLAEAERYQKKYLKVIPDDRKGAYVSAYAHLALIQLSRGDLSSADSSLIRARQVSYQIRKHVPILMAWLAYAEGTYAAARGEYQSAEKFLREAIKEFIDSRYGPYSPNIALIRSKLAQVLGAQGKLLEAEYEARLAIAHNVEYGNVDAIKTAPVTFRFARILMEQGRIAEAEKIANAAIWVYQSNCSPVDSIEYAEARRTLAEILAQQSHYKQALLQYELIKTSLGAHSLQYKNNYDNDLSYSYSLIHEGKKEQAIKRLSSTVAYYATNYSDFHPFTAQAKGFLAIAAWQNNRKYAEQLFDDSLSVLLDPEKRVGIRQHNLRIIFESYMRLMSKQATHNASTAEKLFQLAEQLRNSSVQSAISAMGARAAVKTPALAGLIQKEQNARFQIKAMESTLNNALASDISGATLKSSIRELQLAQKALYKEIIEQFPEYGNLINPSPSTFAAIKKALKPNESFISLYSAQDQTYTWTLNKNQAAKFSVSSMSYQSVQKTVDDLRKAFFVSEDAMGGIPGFDTAKAYQLYQQILAPTEAIWQSSDVLLLVAHGPLGHLPFSVLPVKKVKRLSQQAPLFSEYQQVPFLVKSHAVVNFPSANAFTTLRSIKTQASSNNAFLGFGDPWFNTEQANEAQKEKASTQLAMRGGMHFRSLVDTSAEITADISILPRLPETADELRGISAALDTKQATIYLGKQANELLVKTHDLKAYNVIVFATHGLIPGDLNGLNQPALAMTAPKVSGTQGDGLLTMDEIMNLNMNADWVVLSACNTGSSDGSGAEAVSGLGRAFFYAGARSLLVSNWPVETQSAKLLTTGIFKENKGLNNPALALQSSMKNLIENGYSKNEQTGQINFSYAHPIFWSPFSLVGN